MNKKIAALLIVTFGILGLQGCAAIEAARERVEGVAEKGYTQVREAKETSREWREAISTDGLDDAKADINFNQIHQDSIDQVGLSFLRGKAQSIANWVCELQNLGVSFDVIQSSYKGKEVYLRCRDIANGDEAAKAKDVTEGGTFTKIVPADVTPEVNTAPVKEPTVIDKVQNARNKLKGFFGTDSE